MADIATKGRSRPKAAPSPWKQKKRKVKKPQGGVASLNGKWGYLFIAPFVAMFLIFGLFPVVYSTKLAFYKYDPLSLDQAWSWVGLQNFKDILADSTFWISLGNTFEIWALSTFPQMIMAIGFAAILRNRFLRGKTFWRTILLVPNITSVIAVAIIFGQLFGRDYGMINNIIGFFGFPHIDFIENSFASHVAVAVMITWRWVGYNSLIFLASMLAIPDDLYESASLDGAGAWKQFRYVTLPGLKNTITFVLIVGTIGGLQVYAEPLTLAGTNDGGSSHQLSTLTMYLYNESFINIRYGYGAAIGILITIIVLVISLINFFITRRVASEDK
jgi:cellobiose transport system permease protein